MKLGGYLVPGQTSTWCCVFINLTMSADENFYEIWYVGRKRHAQSKKRIKIISKFKKELLAKI